MTSINSMKWVCYCKFRFHFLFCLLNLLPKYLQSSSNDISPSFSGARSTAAEIFSTNLPRDFRLEEILFLYYFDKD